MAVAAAAGPTRQHQCLLQTVALTISLVEMVAVAAQTTSRVPQREKLAVAAVRTHQQGWFFKVKPLLATLGCREEMTSREMWELVELVGR